MAIVAGRPASAQEAESIPLVVEAGRPLRVALDEKVRVRSIGQAVSGTLVEPLYCFDRVVVPAGTGVVGHVEMLKSVPTGTRIKGILRGDFSPPRDATLGFDELVLADGTRVPIKTQVSAGSENVSLEVAGASEKAGKVARARQEVARRLDEAVAPFKGPGKVERAKDWIVGRLPFHPQYIPRGTVYTAELMAPLDFGTVSPRERAPAGTLPPPGSVLTARLVTALDSAKTPRATPIRAVLTQPLFSSDDRLILPEGTELEGEVTFAKSARRLHRNGQLRFLFETVKLPERGSEKLLASLHSVQLSRDDHIAVDEEGGASVTSSKTRFIAPALALLAARASLDREGGDHDAIGDAPDGPRGHVGGRGVGGFFGLSILGVALSQASRPVAGALGVLGFVRTAYGAVFGKGRDVVFPANTAIQLKLAPGPARQ